MDLRKYDLIDELTERCKQSFACLKDTGDYIPPVVIEGMCLIIFKQFKKDRRKPAKEYRKFKRMDRLLSSKDKAEFMKRFNAINAMQYQEFINLMQGNLQQQENAEILSENAVKE